MLKFVTETLKYFLKNFQNLYDFPHSLNLNLKFFELENNSGTENINESLGGLRFHPILDIWDLFAKIKYQTTF